MKKFMSTLFVTAMLAATLNACSSDNSANEAVANNTAANQPQVSSEAAEGVSDILGTQVITKVYGDGQKVKAVAVRYNAPIAADSLSTEDFDISGYEVTNVYTNSEAALSDSGADGNYVIVEVSTDAINSGYRADMDGPGGGSSDGPGSGERPELSGSPEAPAGGEQGGGFGGDSTPSNQLAVTLTQTGDIAAVDGEIYAASATAIQTNYADNVNLGVQDFEQLTYTNPDNGDTLMYNLYIPEGYDANTAYPLVLFMPDATATGSDPVKTLTQGLGAIVWATDASQAAHASFVLAPQYTNDGANDAANTVALLKELVKQYGIDNNRLYVTGQSAGTIRAIQLMIDNPDLFAAAMLVAGQADSSYADRLSELKDQNIWMIASTGDERALPGMTAIQEAVEAAGVTVAKGQWSASVSEDEQNEKAAAMAAQGTTINFTVLSDVVPEGVTSSAVTEHLNTWRVAYSVSGIRDWIFNQIRQ